MKVEKAIREDRVTGFHNWGGEIASQPGATDTGVAESQKVDAQNDVLCRFRHHKTLQFKSSIPELDRENHRGVNLPLRPICQIDR